MTPEEFYREVESLLTDNSRQRRRVLSDLKELLDFGITPEDLGSPEEYAGAATMASDEGAGSPAYSRVWDPQNPKILVPRVVGLGWDINLGAVAVKLGWLRPDDIDEDVLSAIPRGAMVASSLLPAVGATVTIVASLIAARRSSGSLPSGWNWKFQPRNQVSTITALLPGIALSVGASAWSSLAQDRHDQLSRNVFGSLLSLIAAGSAVMTARSTVLGDRPQPVAGSFGILMVPFAGSLAAGLVPVRAGLRNLWKRKGLSA